MDVFNSLIVENQFQAPKGGDLSAAPLFFPYPQ